MTSNTNNESRLFGWLNLYLMNPIQLDPIRLISRWPINHILVLPLKVKVGESNPDITGGGKEKRFQLNLLPPPSRLPPSTLQAHDQSAPTAHPICKTSPKSKTTHQHHQVPITHIWSQITHLPPIFHHQSLITHNLSPMSGRWVSKWWVLSKNIFLWVKWSTFSGRHSPIRCQCCGC